MKRLLLIAFATPLFAFSQSEIDHWESIALDSTIWSFLLPEEQPDGDWMTVEFDDVEWETGISGFGYSDGDDNTGVPATPSIYMRHAFELSDTSFIEAMIFDMDYDDGFAAYLNGVEIARENLGDPGEVIDWDAELEDDHEAVLYSGGYPSTFTLSDYTDIIVEGTNVLSVEVHNVGPGSSDLTARPFLHIGISQEEITYSDPPDWFEEPEIPCDVPNYSITLYTEAWAGEVSWQILTLDDEFVVGGNGYQDYEMYEIPICLFDGCYQFLMLDSWGDGWNGASFQMTDNDGNVIIQGQLFNGFEEVLVFVLNAECEILGCTDSAALNYWPFANTDDGSCVVFAETNLPIVVITSDEAIPDDPRIVAHMGIINNPDGLNAVDDPFTDYDGQIAIEIRGSSSQMFPKKSYALETQDSLGMNNNVSLLGMPAENDWILHGPYSDKTHMRNALTFQLGRDIGRYTPRTRYCEVLINDDYRGVYMLMENIKRDENRVDIATLLPTDIEGDELTGGYILKVDKFTGDFEGGWTSPYPTEGGEELVIQFHKPEIDDLAEEQQEYIQEAVTEFEEALWGDDFADSTDGYHPFIDVDSFIDLHLINELSRNIDGYRLSTYFHKQKDSNGGKIIMGPWWDYNLSFANADYCFGWSTSGWEVDSDCGNSNPFWFERLKDDEHYRNMTRCKWEDYRANAWSDDNVHALIDSLELTIMEGQVRNFTRWETLGTYVWPNYFIGQTFEEEMTILRDWTDARLVWLDENIEGVCTPGCMDAEACNYMPDAIYDDGSCTYAEPLYDCEGACLNDFDIDEVCDEIDNCPEVYNPLQIDTDGDGFGDDCQPKSVEEYSAQDHGPLVKITDLLGREVSSNATGALFFIYADGHAEKRVILMPQN